MLKLIEAFENVFQPRDFSDKEMRKYKMKKLGLSVDFYVQANSRRQPEYWRVYQTTGFQASEVLKLPTQEEAEDISKILANKLGTKYLGVRK